MVLFVIAYASALNDLGWEVLKKLDIIDKQIKKKEFCIE